MKGVCRCIVRCGAVVLRHVSLVSKDLDYSYRISLIPKCKPRAWCVDRVASVRGGCPHFECAGREARRDADGAAIICHADCIDVLPFSTPLLNLQRWCSGVCRLRDAGYRKDQPFPRHHRRCSPQHSWLWCTGSKSHGGEQEHPIKNVSHSFVYYFGNKKRHCTFGEQALLDLCRHLRRDGQGGNSFVRCLLFILGYLLLYSIS